MTMRSREGVHKWQWDQMRVYINDNERSREGVHKIKNVKIVDKSFRFNFKFYLKILKCSSSKKLSL